MYRPQTSYYYRNIISIDAAKCLNCHCCIKICPREALRLREGGAIVVDTDHCAGCLVCEAQCGIGAISHKTVPCGS